DRRHQLVQRRINSIRIDKKKESPPLYGDKDSLFALYIQIAMFSRERQADDFAFVKSCRIKRIDNIDVHVPQSLQYELHRRVGNVSSIVTRYDDLSNSGSQLH